MIENFADPADRQRAEPAETAMTAIETGIASAIAGAVAATTVADVRPRAVRKPWRRRCCARCSTAATSTAPPRRAPASAWRSWPSPSVYARHRRPAGDVRGGAGQPCRAPRRVRRTRSRPRGPTSSTATAKILATDVRAPSLFAEPRKHHRRRRGGRAAHRRAARSRRHGSARPARLASAASSGSSARSRRSSSRKSIELGLPGIGFLTENKRVYPNGAEVSHVIGHVNIDNQGIAGIEKWLDGHGLAGAAHGGPRHRPAAEAGRARGRSARAACAARRADRRRATSSRRKAAAGLIIDVRTGEIVAMVSVPDYDPNNPKRGATIRRASTG